MIKSTIASFALLSGIAHAVIVQNTSDLLFVVGQGENQAQLVVDFNDGQGVESFAWGYRFDGLASGAEMLLAIADADPDFSLMSGGTAANNFFLTSINYAGREFVNDFTAPGLESWGYYVGGEGESLPTAWTVSGVGAAETSFGQTGRLLSDGSWDAWSFGELSDGFAHLVSPGPEAPTAAVPEPSSLLLTGLSLALMLRRRR